MAERNGNYNRKVEPRTPLDPAGEDLSKAPGVYATHLRCLGVAPGDAARAAVALNGSLEGGDSRRALEAVDGCRQAAKRLDLTTTGSHHDTIEDTLEILSQTE